MIKISMTICWSDFLLSVKLSLLGVDSSDWLRRTPADHEVRLGSFKHWHMPEMMMRFVGK